ncbi:twin-arginine translocation protein, TatB subunit [Pseudonocardia dioxanivorans CB1190]|uniref:Twin-arginine translocation protein, TatB subunit n=1 Tax=Pseudonocardia dioxanivorans (strain ATCC 55486 / DSM 44775 / JCM 13855 / CB1190) TaxID=675635 RepID=F4CLZ1_PSEUX|nr:twin-arginine translocation protein, TatB subunit [Pseudonocardia dioxanivorans CB1190]
MFDISVAKLIVLALVALFVLGPERLPGAAQWLGRAIRTVRTFASDAQKQVNREIGPEWREVRETLSELPVQELRTIRNGTLLGTGLAVTIALQVLIAVGGVPT